MNGEYCVGIRELFSLNWGADPCVDDENVCCTNLSLSSKTCPVGVDFFRFPSGELRLDFALCNLRCVACWAKQCPHDEHFNCYQLGFGSKLSFSSEEIVERMVCRAKKVNEYLEADKSFQIRVTGGEPFLSVERWNHIAEMLSFLDEKLDPRASDYEESLDKRLHDYGSRNDVKRKRVVIQTNGTLLGRTISIEDVRDVVRGLKHLNVVIHNSIKGSNPDEFRLLTRSNKALFSHQVALINELLTACESTVNLDFQIVLGFFHSENHILWNPLEEKNMLTMPDQLLLREVKRNWERTYVEPLDFRSRMVENAHTIDRCLNEGIIKKREQVTRSSIVELEPLPHPGRKVKIKETFWRKL